MSSFQRLAALVLCVAVAGMTTGCDVNVESDTDETTEDTGTPDTNTDPDTGTPDTGDPDTGSADTGSIDTGSTDTGSVDTGSTDAGGDTDGGVDPHCGGMTEAECVARGQYIVDHVAICIDCHTPRKADGSYNMDMYLAGVDGIVDLSGDPTDGVGAISSKNLTNHETGLKNYSDDTIRKVIREGLVSHDGTTTALFPMMPAWTFGNMTDADLDAVIAYLRTVPAIDREEQPREPLPGPFAPLDTRTEPQQLLTLDQYPETTLQPGDQGYDMAQKGKYLVAIAGCVECHTEEVLPPADNPNGQWLPADATKLMQGGRYFPPPLDATSTNMTPHATGIGDYTPEEIRIAIKTGKDNDGRQLCPPMPAGPASPFGGMTDEDALAIGWYLTTIEGVERDIPECNFN